ncbi:MAG: VPLPA-CTERM sorting domain-containing protein [Paracoccaceae bacterium]
MDHFLSGVVVAALMMAAVAPAGAATLELEFLGTNLVCDPDCEDLDRVVVQVTIDTASAQTGSVEGGIEYDDAPIALEIDFLFADGTSAGTVNLSESGFGTEQSDLTLLNDSTFFTSPADGVSLAFTSLTSTVTGSLMSVADGDDAAGVVINLFSAADPFLTGALTELDQAAVDTLATAPTLFLTDFVIALGITLPMDETVEVEDVRNSTAAVRISADFTVVPPGPVAIPLPAALPLLITGLVGLAFLRRRA